MPATDQANLFELFFENSLDCQCIANFNGYYTHVNRATTETLGYSREELLSRPYVEFVHPDDIERTTLQIAAGASSGEVIYFENRYLHADGSPVHLAWSARVYPEKLAVFASARDISARASAGAEALKILDHAERLIELLPDPVCVHCDGKIRYVNSALLGLLGYEDASALLGRDVRSAIIFPADQAIVAQRQREIRKAGHIPLTNVRLVHRDGHPVWFEAHATTVSLNGEPANLIVFRDLSHAQQGKLLTRAVKFADEERRRICRELHDETAQWFAATSFGLQTLLRSSLDPMAARDVRRILDQNEETMHNVARLARGLHPSTLERLGLQSALMSLADDFTAAHGVPAETKLEPLSDVTVPDDVEVDIYRLFQEALENIARHAEATTVELSAVENDGMLRLELSDNGVGFPFEDTVPSEALGILGMRERAAHIGGEFTIDSKPGSGTRVTLTVKL